MRAVEVPITSCMTDGHAMKSVKDWIYRAFTHFAHPDVRVHGFVSVAAYINDLLVLQCVQKTSSL